MLSFLSYSEFLFSWECILLFSANKLIPVVEFLVEDASRGKMHLSNLHMWVSICWNRNYPVTRFRNFKNQLRKIKRFVISAGTNVHTTGTQAAFPLESKCRPWFMRNHSLRWFKFFFAFCRQCPVFFKNFRKSPQKFFLEHYLFVFSENREIMHLLSNNFYSIATNLSREIFSWIVYSWDKIVQKMKIFRLGFLLGAICANRIKVYHHEIFRAYLRYSRIHFLQNTMKFLKRQRKVQKWKVGDSKNKKKTK